MVTKTTITKKPEHRKAVRKPKTAKSKVNEAVKQPIEPAIEPTVQKEQVVVNASGPIQKKAADKSKYIFATGRRKTSVANIRLFVGKAENLVNKKHVSKYFLYPHYQEDVLKPFSLTGLNNQYHFICQVNGGGLHSQVGAIKHGLALALSKISPELRKILKKNGLLTRDDRKKERKKPGLKRARRAPQWAKR